MNVQRDPDAILAAWLEEGPTRLPEGTRRAIAVTTRTTEQKRRSLWAPWRTPLMPSVARLAAAAIAILVALGGVVYFIGPGQGVGGPPPTSRPTVAPTPSLVPPSFAAIDVAAGTLVYEIRLPADALPRWDGITLAISHVTIPAATVTEWRASEGSCCPGLKIKFIVEGTLKVVSEGPLQVIRAGASMETISAGTEITAGPGDTLLTRNEIGDTYSNVGPVHLIATDVLAGIVPNPPVPPKWQPQELDARENISLPAGPQVLQLHRIKITAGEQLAPPPGGHHLAVSPGNTGAFFNSGAFFSHAEDDVMTVRGAPSVSGDAYVLTQQPG